MSEGTLMLRLIGFKGNTLSLRKHANSNIKKISPKKKNEIFQVKKLIFFIFLLKT